jgi:hypothetical protein
MNKKINFIPRSKLYYDVMDAPVPAKKLVPEWFKKIPAEVSGFSINPRERSTVKKCMPFIDALTTGYIITAPMDIAVEKMPSGELSTTWGFVEGNNESMLDLDSPKHRSDRMPAPEGYDKNVWTFTTYGKIQTPPGYSMLVTHPFNRYDLPFLTLSGVIDSDQIQVSLVVNCYIRSDFTGIIEKGTPLAQVFPFKRENWDHEVLQPWDETQEAKEMFKLRATLVRAYQRFFWQKKTYN